MELIDYIRDSNNEFLFNDNQIWDIDDITATPYSQEELNNLYEAIPKNNGIGPTEFIKGRKLEISEDQLYDLYLKSLGNQIIKIGDTVEFFYKMRFVGRVKKFLDNKTVLVENNIKWTLNIKDCRKIEQLEENMG